MNEQEKAIYEMRELSEKFLLKDLDYTTFIQKISFILGRDFDHIEDYIDTLSIEHQKELLFYDKMTGGEFYQYENEIPKNPDWKYGESEEKYGWVDKEKYFSFFKSEFSKIIKV